MFREYNCVQTATSLLLITLLTNYTTFNAGVVVIKTQYGFHPLSPIGPHKSHTALQLTVVQVKSLFKTALVKNIN